MQITIDLRLLGRGGRSGIEEYTINLVSEMLKAGKHDFNFFYNGFKMHPLPQDLLERGEVLDWKIPNKLLEASFRFLKYPKIKNCDAVFSPHFNLMECGDIPRVVTFHDLSFVHHPDFFSFKQKFWHYFQNYAAQAKRASKIIAVSEFTKNDLINILKIPSEKIKVIHSGIDKKFKPLVKQSSEILNFKTTRGINYPFILYLGTIEPRKNINGLIRAFNLLKSDKKYKDFKLVLAGARGWLYKEINKEALRSPFANDIIFWNAVSPDERVFLYNLASVFVYPSFFEGFGFPPLEAQASGVPVVASYRTSLPEILGESALLVNPWKVSEIAGAMAACIDEDNLKANLVKMGIVNAQKFSWEVAAQKTLKAIEGVADNQI